MTLNNDTAKDSLCFPTHPAYLVPVEVKEIPEYGEGQMGVFATEPIAKGTKLWIWTDRVISIHHKDLDGYIQDNFGDDTSQIKVFLRQGFVLPQSSSSETMTPPSLGVDGSKESSDNVTRADDYLHSNPTDCGRFTNHSPDPNTGPDGAIQDILPGEELTIDYSFHGNPVWYQAICAKYGVLTETQVAAQYKKAK